MSRAARRGAWLAALGWVVALHAGLTWIEHRPEPRRLWGDENRYLDGARSYLAGEAWSPDPPLWPTAYARFVAPLLARAEPQRGGGARWPVEAVQLGLLALSALLLRGIGRALLGEGAAPDLAALGLLAYPPLAAYAHYLWPEIVHLALLLLATWILVAGRRGVGRRGVARRGVGWLLLLGAALGLAAAVKSLLLPLVPLVLAVLALEGGWRRGWLRAALVAVVVVAVLAPGTVRSLRQHGEPSGRSTALFNLWVGLNDTSPTNLVDPVVERELVAYRDSASDSRGRNRWLRRRIGERVREIGPLPLLTAQLGRQYRRLLDKESFLTDQLPGGAAAARKVGYRDPPDWLAAGLRGSSYGLWGAILLLAPLGFAVYRPRGWRSWRWLPLVFVAYNLGLFLLLHVKTRYRVPLLPFLLLAAAAGAVHLAERWRGRAPRGTGRGDEAASTLALVAAGAVSGLLLFLAFGP